MTMVHYICHTDSGEIVESGTVSKDAFDLLKPERGETVRAVMQSVDDPSEFFWKGGLRKKTNRPDEWHYFDICSETWAPNENAKNAAKWGEFNRLRAQILSENEFKLFDHYPSPISEKIALNALFQQSRDIPETTTDPIEAMVMLNEIWGL